MSSEVWSSRSLGDLISITKGASYSSDDLKGDGALVGLKAIKPGGGFRLDGHKPYGGSFKEPQALEPGDLVVALTDLTQDGSVLGSPAIIPDLGISPLVVSLDLGKVSVKEGVDRSFVYFLLCDPSFRSWAQAFASGTTIRRIKGDDLLGVEMPLPDFFEQRRIAWVLGTLDDKIELNRKMARTLEETAAAIFKARFVDFEGVGEFDDSEIGPIPKGWSVTTAGEALSPVGGSTPSTKNPDYWDGGVNAWATPRDLSGLEGPFLMETGRSITDAGLGKIGSGLLPAGTVLLSSRAPVGYTAIAGLPLAVNQGFIAIKETEQLKSTFILLWIRSRLREIKQRASGTTFAEISKEKFRPIPFLLPDQGTLVQFDDEAGPLLRKVMGLNRESETLTALRDELLPKLVSGKIRVPEGVGPDLDDQTAQEVAEELAEA